MKKRNIIFFVGTVLVAFATLLLTGCIKGNETKYEQGENEEYDGPEKAIEFEIERTRDLSTGKVPWNKLLKAIQQTEMAKDVLRNDQNRIVSLSWIERGPNSDVTGPSNGNTRANSGVAAGRVRALLVDSLDPTHKTVFAGGVDGGLWKTIRINNLL